jgi:hypothetical protein
MNNNVQGSDVTGKMTLSGKWLHVSWACVRGISGLDRAALCVLGAPGLVQRAESRVQSLWLRLRGVGGTAEDAKGRKRSFDNALRRAQCGTQEPGLRPWGSPSPAGGLCSVALRPEAAGSASPWGYIGLKALHLWKVGKALEVFASHDCQLSLQPNFGESIHE